MVAGLKDQKRKVAGGAPRACRRLLAISQDGPSADRGKKEALLGFVLSSLRDERTSVAGVRLPAEESRRRAIERIGNET